MAILCWCNCSSQASLSTRRSSHVPSDTASRLHGRDSMVGSTSGRTHLLQQQQQQQERRKSSKDVIMGAVPGSESLFSSMPPSLAAAFELPGIHISRIETLDFEDDVSRYTWLTAAVWWTGGWQRSSWTGSHARIEVARVKRGLGKDLLGTPNGDNRDRGGAPMECRAKAPQTELHVARCYLSFGSRAFRTAAPTVWNSLPLHVRSCTTLTTFRKI